MSQRINIKKHQILLLFICFILIGTSYKGNAITTQHIPNNQIAHTSELPVTPNSYVALGDSITLGTGLLNKESNFVTLFSQDLKQTTPDLITTNYGKNGYTISDITKQLSDPEVNQQPEHAKYITITAGGNDIVNLTAAAAEKYTGKSFRNAKAIPKFAKNEATAKLLLSYLKSSEIQNQLANFLSTFHQDYTELLDTVRRLAPNATILVQTIYNPASGSKYHALSECIDQVMPQANAIIRECASKEDNSILLLDTYQLFQNNAPTYVRIQQDDIHPTEAGHQLIAMKLAQLLKYGQKNEKTQTVANRAQSNTVTPINETQENATYFANRFLTFVSLGFILGLCILCGIRIWYCERKHS